MLSVVDEARVLAGEAHAAWSESFNELFAQVAGAFGNAAVRRHGRAYLLGLLSQTERKNGWTLAEFAGDASPDGLQRLLNFSPWDEDACRDAVRRYVVAHLGNRGRGAGRRRTGFLEEGPDVGRCGQAIYGHGRAGGELPGGGFPGVRGPGREPGADRPGAVPAGEVGV